MGMKNQIILLALAVLCSCAPKEQVVLREIKNLTVDLSKQGEPVLKADALFFNPNNISMKLKEISIDVFVDGKKAAHTGQKLNSQIKGQSEFNVPLEVQVSLKEMGLVDTLLGFLGGRKYKVRYAGFIRIGVHGLRLKIPVDETKEVKFRN